MAFRLRKRGSNSGPSERVPWRTLAPTVLLPNVLHGSGQGAVVPAIPLAAFEVTGSYASAALVAAMLTFGQLLFALPAGSLVTRINEKTAMLASTAVTAAGGLGAFFAPSLWTLMVSVFLMGSGVAVFTMARHAWITVAVPIGVRGRSLSAVAFFNRFGLLIGPFLAAALFAGTGAVRSAFMTVVVTSVVLFALVLAARFPVDDKTGDDDRPRVFRTLWESRGVLLRLGLVVSILSTMRTTRRIFVPLIGIALGIDAVGIALIVGFSSAIDLAMVYLGGMVIDRFGRLWVAVPPLVVFGLTHLVIAGAAHLPNSQVWFISAVMIMAAGNGISGGAVATIGSDLADQRNPGAFLGSWRLITELGPSLVPLAIGGLTAVASIGVACAATGVLALFGAALLPRYVRRYLPARPGAPNTADEREESNRG